MFYEVLPEWLIKLLDTVLKVLNHVATILL
jgi:hypothetical protein